eukprot:7024961-Prymnesium_polylepis.1
MDRKALAIKIMDTFIRYPLPDRSVRLVPYNYCALPRLLPSWVAPAATRLLSVLCTPRGEGGDAGSQSWRERA